MSFQLCSSCRHSFPESSLEEASFSSSVSKYFDRVQTLASSLKGNSARDVSNIQELQVLLQELCAAVHEDVDAMKQKVKQAEVLCSNRERDLNDANSKIATANALAATMGGGQSNNNATLSRSPAAAADAVQRPPFNGTVPGYQQKKMTSALDLISASVYSLLESVAIQTRVDTALLWIRPRGHVSMELVAPFVVGRDLSALRNSAPYRVPETAMPCVVSATGTAINIKPRPGERDSRRAEEIELTELIENSNAAQLLMPVFTRYGQQDRSVLAVIHLIGSPRFPYPFSRDDEEVVFQAASFFSMILSSHHSVMVNEWTNHFYNPSVLLSTSTFRGDLDLRGDEKGIDDFRPPPTLVYRCEKEDTADVDPREVYKNLKSSIARRAVPMHTVVNVKDLNRYANNMEKNWVSAVEANSRLEDYVGTIQAGLIAHDVAKLREMREVVWKEEGNSYTNALFSETGVLGDDAPATSAAAAAASPQADEEGEEGERRLSIHSLDVQVHLSPAVTVAEGAKTAADILKPEEVAELELVAMKRLRDLGVDPTPFLTQ